jgi:secretion/DNA translocation related TadE-like protein
MTTVSGPTSRSYGRSWQRNRSAATSDREQGSATVLVAAAVGLVAVVSAAVLVVVGLVRDLHHARGTADLAALAAAGPTAVGGIADCSAGAWVARRAGARLVSCRTLADGSVRVAVSVPVQARSWLPGVPATVSGSARAGVVDDSGGRRLGSSSALDRPVELTASARRAGLTAAGGA